MAYYCLHKFHWTPSQILQNLENEEYKAFIEACISIRIDAEKEQEKKLKRM